MYVTIDIRQKRKADKIINNQTNNKEAFFSWIVQHKNQRYLAHMIRTKYH